MKPSVWGGDSISFYVFSIALPLPGFFLAALSISATFQRPGIDDEIYDKETKYPLYTNGNLVWDVPSKRQIAIYLFHFLLVLSIFVVVISGAFSFLFEDAALNLILGRFFQSVSLVCVFGLSYLMVCLLVVLIGGVQFFVERLMRDA